MTQPEEDVMAVHVLNKCQVGYEEPCFLNRTLVVPRCYVPAGSSKDASAESSPSAAFREETGLQYNTGSSLICPFMVHQRVSLDQFFIFPPNEDEKLPTPIEVLERGIQSAARMASTALQGTPTILFSSPFSSSFAAEAGMLHGQQKNKKAAKATPGAFVHMDVEVRLGTTAIAPSAVAPTISKSLSQEQFEYASRFQLLTDRGAPKEGPIEGDSQAAPPAVESIRFVRALTLGAFNPHLPSTPFGDIHKAINKMSKSTLSKGREAVPSKLIPPRFQIVFQQRIPGMTASSLVLETPDGGISWFEVVQQKTVSSISTPIINSTCMSLESVMVAKHVRPCSGLEEELASYYIQTLFCESKKSAAAHGKMSTEDESVEDEEATGKGRAKTDRRKYFGSVTYTASSAVGAAHRGKSEAERNWISKWQLVSIEKSDLSTAFCVDSEDILPSLPRSVHTTMEEVDAKQERAYAQANNSELEAVAASTSRNNLFVTTWLHTRTQYIDDGSAVVRGDTSFQRRVTLSNKTLHTSLSSSTSTSTKPMFSERAHLPTRLGAALQSVINESINMITHRLSVGVLSANAIVDLLSGVTPSFVFPADRGCSHAVALANAPLYQASVTGTPPAAILCAAYKAEIEKGALMTTTIAIHEHATYLAQHSHQLPPTVAIARSASFQSVVPWHLVRYPVALNNFHEVRLPSSIPAVGTSFGSVPTFAADTRFSNALALSTALIRNRGASLLFIARKTGATSNELAAFDSGILPPACLKLPPVTPEVFEEITTQKPLSYAQAELRHPRMKHDDERVIDNLLRVKIPQAMEKLGRAARVGGTGKGDSKLVFEAPVFCASFGSDSSSFTMENHLRKILPRVLGKSIKTTVSAITVSDLPSKAVRAMDPASRTQTLETLSPLGTRYVTSVFLDSKDASKSFVMDISKRAATPLAQELLVQTVLRRMVAPASLRFGQINVQTSGNPDDEEQPQRELWEADGHNIDDSFYRLNWVPEDALNVFRGNAALVKAAATQEILRAKALRGDDAPAPTKFMAQMGELGEAGLGGHLDELRTNDAKFHRSITVGGCELTAEQQQTIDSEVSPTAYKGQIASAVSVSKALLDNTKPVRLADLLEAQSTGEGVFGYLPQLLATLGEELNVEDDGKKDGAGSGFTRLLTRDMSRVVFAEDRTYRAEGVLMNNSSASGSTPPMFVVVRTIHDISTGVDGVARYETNSQLFFTMRDPAIIVGANGDMTRLESMLGKDRGGSQISESLVIEEALHVFRNLGRWLVDSTFASPTERDVVEKEGETSSGRSVQDVLKGWIDSSLARQSSDVLEMVQGDEKLAANRLTHVLVHAARLTGEEAEAHCRNELLHWIGALGSETGIITVKDLEHAYLHSQLHMVLRRCGIPLKPSSMFYSKVQQELLKERGESPTRANADPHLMILPCDSYCRLTKELVLQVGMDRGAAGEGTTPKTTLVPVFLPTTLHTSDGMVLPEGTLAFVGHASTQTVRECGHFFGDLVAIHQVGDFLLIPATEDVDVQVGVELSNAQDQVWKSPMEQQFARMKTLEGHPVVMKRNRFGQFAPPSLFERTFIENAKLYQLPAVGAPLYREGKLVTFNKGVGTHSFVSSVLRSGNMRKMISYLAKH